VQELRHYPGTHWVNIVAKLANHSWYTLAGYGWYRLADARWYSIARLLTLMLLAQWITKGRADLVQSGLATIRTECRPWAARVAGVLLRTSSLMRPALWLAAKSYGTTVRLIGRIQSERGWQMSRRAARSS
jgi:hypothetical protein